MLVLRALVLALVLGSISAPASPVADLASSDQATRDHAADLLHRSYTPTPQETWNPLLAQFSVGMPQKALEKLLVSYHAQPEIGAVGVGTSFQCYRLDSQWVLQCDFTDKESTLADWELVESVQSVWVPPPPSFTGRWITYFVNGIKCQEANYQNGFCFGDVITYHPDGTTASTRHYDQGGLNGDERSFYASGQISFRAHYSNNAPIGIWVWYSPDGGIASTKVYGE